MTVPDGYRTYEWAKKVSRGREVGRRGMKGGAEEGVERARASLELR